MSGTVPRLKSNGPESMIVWQVVFFGHSWYGTILLYKDMGVVILPLEKACMAIGGLSVNLNRKKLSVVYWYDLLILNIHYLIFITLSVYLVTSCHNQTGYLRDAFVYEYR